MAPSSRWVLGGLSLLLLFHGLLFWGLKEEQIFVLTGVFGLLSIWLGHKRSIAVSASFLTSSCVAAGIVFLGNLDRSLYYRPHETLGEYDYGKRHHRYARNADLTMQVPYGDLRRMSPMVTGHPRSVRFKTDSDGFRNDADYAGQPYLALGDSFVLGAANTQEDVLTVQLARDHGLDVYNLGHSASPRSYEEMLEGFTKSNGDKARVLLFFFEGNDFDEEMDPREDSESLLERIDFISNRYMRMFSGTGLYRLARTQRNAIKLRRANRAWADPIRIASTAAGPMAFHMSYVQTTERRAYTLPPEFGALLGRMADRIEAVFFIPTKYRVYHPQLAPGEELANVNWASLRELCDAMNLTCVDLTPALAQRSDELLLEGRFTYWPDDTHWNGEGMAVAAEAVAQLLRESSPR